MIELEVLHSAQDELGPYRYEFHEITVGHTPCCDLILSRGKGEFAEFTLSLSKEGLFLHTKENAPVVLNGQSALGRLKLAAQDLIELPVATIRVVNFVDSQAQDNFPYDDYEQLAINKDPKMEWLLKIEEKLHDLKA